MTRELSVNRPTEQQQSFFNLFKEFNFKNAHSATTHYGSAIEKIICTFMGLNPIPINGNYDVNFDAFKGDDFYEIKSVRQGGKVVIYDFRMRKEEPFRDKLFYVFGIHRVKNAKSNRDLWEQFEEKGVHLIVRRSEEIHKAAFAEPLKKMKEGACDVGYNRKGYADGYRNLPIKPFFKTPSFSSILEIYDFKIEVWFHYG